MAHAREKQTEVPEVELSYILTQKLYVMFSQTIESRNFMSISLTYTEATAATTPSWYIRGGLFHFTLFYFISVYFIIYF